LGDSAIIFYIQHLCIRRSLEVVFESLQPNAVTFFPAPKISMRSARLNRIALTVVAEMARLDMSSSGFDFGCDAQLNISTVQMIQW
jgi:hypothetical protein